MTISDLIIDSKLRRRTLRKKKLLGSDSKIASALKKISFLLLLSFPLSSSARSPKSMSPSGKYHSLTAHQHEMLAAHVQSTLLLQAGKEIEQELECLTHLAREVDFLITTSGGSHPTYDSKDNAHNGNMFDRRSQWGDYFTSADEGLSKREGDQLLGLILNKLPLLSLPSSLNCNSYLPPSEVREASRRMSTVIVRALLRGNFLNLSGNKHEFVQDLIRSVFGDDNKSIGFTLLLGLSCIGAFLIIDKYLLSRLEF